MKAKDVIFYKPAQHEELRESLQKEVETALVSFPFWASREKIKNVKFGLHNYLIKSLPKVLFNLFAKEQNLSLDFKAGKRAFPNNPVFDFSFENTAWHIQNNFVQNPKPLHAEEYVYLPALIPNRFKNDNWSKRDKFLEGYKNTGFLFTFLSEDSDKTNPLFDLAMDYRTLNFLSALKSKNEDRNPKETPYSESWFWSEFLKISEIPQVTLNTIPTLVIAGVAQENHFGYFADTDEKANLCYRLYRGNWYVNREGGGLSFCKGLIKTHIKNATCPMAALGSFNSVFLKSQK